jgi:hypothetical protein
VRLDLFHDRLPHPPGQKRVLRGKARLEDDLIEAVIGGALPFDCEQAQGFVFILRFQRLLFAGARVLQIINLAAAVDAESLLHRRMLEAG